MSKKISATLSDQMFETISYLAEKDGRSLSCEINFMLQQFLIRHEGDHYRPKVREQLIIYRVIKERDEPGDASG